MAEFVTKFFLCSLDHLTLPVPLTPEFLIPSLMLIQLFVRLEITLTKRNSKIKATLKLLQYTNKWDDLGQLFQQSLSIIKLQLQGEVTRDTLSSLFPRKGACSSSFILAECTSHQSWYSSDFSMSQFMAEPGSERKLILFLFD